MSRILNFVNLPLHATGSLNHIRPGYNLIIPRTSGTYVTCLKSPRYVMFISNIVRGGGGGGIAWHSGSCIPTPHVLIFNNDCWTDFHSSNYKNSSMLLLFTAKCHSSELSNDIWIVVPFDDDRRKFRMKMAWLMTHLILILTNLYYVTSKISPSWFVKISLLTNWYRHLYEIFNILYIFISTWGPGLGTIPSGLSSCRLSSTEIPMIKIRRSHKRLIFIIGISIHEKTVFVLKHGPDTSPFLRRAARRILAGHRKAIRWPHTACRARTLSGPCSGSVS